LYSTDNTFTLMNSTVSGNEANSGGGVFVDDYGGTFSIISTLINGNTATVNGGGFRSAIAGKITNSTVAGNYAGDNGGGIDNYGSLLTIVNSIVYGNDSINGGKDIRDFPNDTNVSYLDFVQT